MSLSRRLANLEQQFTPVTSDGRPPVDVACYWRVWEDWQAFQRQEWPANRNPDDWWDMVCDSSQVYSDLERRQQLAPNGLETGIPCFHFAMYFCRLYTLLKARGEGDGKAAAEIDRIEAYVANPDRGICLPNFAAYWAWCLILASHSGNEEQTT